MEHLSHRGLVETLTERPHPRVSPSASEGGAQRSEESEKKDGADAAGVGNILSEPLA